MNSVATTQQQLMQAIYSMQGDSHFDVTGLKAYQANLLASAQRSLALTYPTIAQLLGEDALNVLGLRLLKQYPHRTGDWALFGAQLDTVIEASTELDDYPYLAQSAYLDYQVHLLQGAEDCDFEQTSLTLLADAEPDHIAIELSPNLKWFSSDFAVVDIYLAHQNKQEQLDEPLDAAEINLDAAQNALIYRPKYKVEVEKVDEIQLSWLKLLQHHSLGEALDKMAETEFDFQTWLLNALEKNWIKRIRVIQ